MTGLACGVCDVSWNYEAGSHPTLVGGSSQLTEEKLLKLF